ncbi:integration host factor subunit beta [Marinicella gelatinilytica]|uniref:integration host factor subunit beta n=1 Tax=Marinicella gelatinilytica TaxID=2996017 RepID=UPI002260CE75|nr:integration host factor subunit beta [Marinicella gelatinilytica]MCX7544783.1 integration host factor subunit beta [Marinicella gelatinilytica]
MTRSELIEILSEKFAQSELSKSDVSLSVKELIQYMSTSISQGQRIEIRGFGSFTLRERKPRMGRNPKTGEPVPLGAKYAPHFKPGKDLKERVKDQVGK